MGSNWNSLRNDIKVNNYLCTLELIFIKHTWKYTYNAYILELNYVYNLKIINNTVSSYLIFRIFLFYLIRTGFKL